MISKIKAQNFLSWEDLDFSVESGITLIDGWNADDQTSEGSGKSAILNALCWGLYGKLPKDAKIDDVIKTSKKACSVEIEIIHPLYKAIRRQRKPNTLHLIMTDGVEAAGKDAKETQLLIEVVIGLTFDAFCQTVYFAQNFPKKFVTATQEDRGKILSEIQNLDIFDTARKDVIARLKLNEAKRVEVAHAFKNKTLAIEHTTSALARNKQHARELEALKHERLYQLKAEIECANEQEVEIRAAISRATDSVTMEAIQNSKDLVIKLDLDIENLNQQKYMVSNAIQNLSRNTTERHNIRRDIKRYTTNIESLTQRKQHLESSIKTPQESKCTSCGSALSTSNIESLDLELAQLKININDTVIGLENLESRLLDVPEVNIKDLEVQLAALITTINTLNNAKMREVAQQSNQVDNLKQLENGAKLIASKIDETRKLVEIEMTKPAYDNSAETQTLTNALITLEHDVKQLQSLYKTTENHTRRLEALKVGFKEVKSYTFNSVLNELTHRTNKYLIQLFEIPMSIRFTNENMKIGVAITIDGTERGFGLLSGGQQRRVMLSVDLALSNIVMARNNSNSLNLRILDEYFKDLSETSMQKCLNLLEQLGGSTILIEHNSVFKSIINRSYNIELIDGTSRRVES